MLWYDAQNNGTQPPKAVKIVPVNGEHRVSMVLIDEQKFYENNPGKSFVITMTILSRRLVTPLQTRVVSVGANGVDDKYQVTC